MIPLLEIQDLTVCYKKDSQSYYAVKGISFCLFPNQTLALVGESGCGKSSTACALLTRVPKTLTNCQIQGKIIFEGHNILKSSKKQKIPKMGYVFQDPYQALNPTMKIGKQIIESLLVNQKLSKDQTKMAALELMDSCGLDHPVVRFSQYPHEISGGMRQKVVLALALALDPQIIIADEPTSSLDPLVSLQILHLLQKIQKKTQAAILFISHDLSMVAKFSQQIAIMHGGKIVEYGNTQTVLSSPQHPYTQLLIDAKKNYGQNSVLQRKNPSLYLSSFCSFISDCPHAMQICLHKTPNFNIDEGYACHLIDKRKNS